MCVEFVGRNGEQGEEEVILTKEPFTDWGDHWNFGGTVFVKQAKELLLMGSSGDLDHLLYILYLVYN